LLMAQACPGARARLATTRSSGLQPPRARTLAACVALGAVALASVVLLAQRDRAPSGRAPDHAAYPAIEASAFLDSLGVNTHLSWPTTPYANLNQVASQLNYVGIRRLRDDFGQTADSHAAVGVLMAQGFQFDLISGGDLGAFQKAVRALALAHPGGVIAIEGPNEVDGWDVKHAGLTGMPAAIRYQRDLFTAVKADPVLAWIPVYNLSVAGVNSSRKLGDLSAYADCANVHLYYGGGQPAYGWSPYDNGHHWSAWMTSGRLAAPDRPLVLTETGATATPAWGGGVDEETQARQILNSLMDAARTGLAGIYLYELVDSHNKGPADDQSHYGLFRWDGSPRPAAVALHNFTRILGLGAEGAGRRGHGTLDYAIDGVPDWGGHLLFQEADGAKDIVVWAEPDIWNESAKTRTPPPRTPITIDLARPARVAIYDPLRGAAPVQVLGTTKRVTLSVTDHPMIVEIKDPHGD
jgi:hypothetical protein